MQSGFRPFVLSPFCPFAIFQSHDKVGLQSFTAICKVDFAISPFYLRSHFREDKNVARQNRGVIFFGAIFVVNPLDCLTTSSPLLPIHSLHSDFGFLFSYSSSSSTLPLLHPPSPVPTFSQLSLNSCSVLFLQGFPLTDFSLLLYYL